MIRKFILPVLLLFSLVSFAQQGSASPYSFFGVGDVRFKGTNEMNAMGGVSILPDSIHINLQNPASYSSLKLTTFTIGGTFSATKFKSYNGSEKAQRTTLDYLAVALPLKKFGVAFGLIPYSSVGYKLKTTDDVNEIIRRYSGDGGLNKAFLGLGYQLNPRISIGADIGYNFGRIETNSIKYLGIAQDGTQEKNVSELSGLSINIGAMYNRKITKKLDFYSGITYAPQSNLNSNNENNIFSIIYLGDVTPIPLDYLDAKNYKNTVKLPSKFSIGAGVGESKKWLIGTEVSFLGSNTFSNRLSNVTNASYENGIKYSVGGFYIPNYNSFSNYLKKVTYRGGFRYEKTGLIINDQKIRDYAFTGGVGLPVGGTFSNVNVGIELGRRGTALANLVEENYANVIISLSLNDKWFTKRKFD
ncbi:hypothetical protein [Flavobacterium psychrotolerans]|uniref:Aromatic hydrocarbon degradation protein n=1 Tax=Flavobacterium psychrotolerans TaxID=2169410 RepID=A0A2U1JLD9_9FLAO|nr:hypothetical protein [Flavobacterium psychrotolerans]PWA05693.1 hypothetical protein DB895_06855 [Flavobacterium psychrotolerans]